MAGQQAEGKRVARAAGRARSGSRARSKREAARKIIRKSGPNLCKFPAVPAWSARWRRELRCSLPLSRCAHCPYLANVRRLYCTGVPHPPNLPTARALHGRDRRTDARAIDMAEPRARDVPPRKRTASARAAAAAEAASTRSDGTPAPPKTPPPAASEAPPLSPQPGMRCVHCGATQTPLWRAGPAGPKTLCNACGVRWKKTGSVVPRARRTIAKPGAATAAAVTAAAGAAARARRAESRAMRAPVAVRVHDAGVARGAPATYESVFAGLMVVPRAARARTRTARAQRFFDGVAAARTTVVAPPPLLPAAASSEVYVTETLAPSPSPSPPPLPRMEPFPEGQGFSLVMHVKPDTRAHPPQ